MVRAAGIVSFVIAAAIVVPALIALRRAHAELLPEHVVCGATDATARLARGDLDVAFYYERISAPDLLVERLGQTTMAVYCGKGHPLFGRARVTPADIEAHPFSVPQVGDTRQSLDGWPSEASRQPASAALAEATAASTSATEPSGTRALTAPVAGLKTSPKRSVGSVVALPSIQWVMVGGVAVMAADLTT